ncbi:MAG TPA: hypothetical protein VEA37_11190 [Flavobacterium sp.]|nr:hypothetical protein [Flavobacterium sp.]
MYYWLYLKFYVYFKSKKGNDSTFDAACLIFLAQVVHFIFVFTLLDRVGLFDFPKISNNNLGKFAYIPLFLPWLVLVYYYYKWKVKRDQRVPPKPLQGYKLATLYAVAVIAPLYIAIKLRGDSLW